MKLVAASLFITLAFLVWMERRHRHRRERERDQYVRGPELAEIRRRAAAEIRQRNLE